MRKRTFLILQLLADGTELRYEVTARNYRTCWRNRSEYAMQLESTRSLVIHEIAPKEERDSV